MRYSGSITAAALSTKESAGASLPAFRLYVADYGGYVFSGAYSHAYENILTGYRETPGEDWEAALTMLCGFPDAMLGKQASVSGGEGVFHHGTFSPVGSYSVFRLDSASPVRMNCILPLNFAGARPDNKYGLNPPAGSYRLTVNAGGRTMPVAITVNIR